MTKADEIRESAVSWSEQLLHDSAPRLSLAEELVLRMSVQKIRWMAEIAAVLTEINTNLERRSSEESTRSRSRQYQEREESESRP